MQRVERSAERDMMDRPVLLTGGGGFIGGRLAVQLRGSGATVRAVARSRRSATRLAELGCEIVAGDLLDPGLLRRAADGCGMVIHAAGDYRVGIGESERDAMEAANVTSTTLVLDAAVAADCERIVHVSTINAFGDTGYRVVDETYERPQPYRYLSIYDETKHRADLVAQARIEAGAPVVIAMPGGVYGPGDHSSLGGVLRQAADGRLPSITFPDLGMNMAHVDDIATGILLVGRDGRVGGRYVLGGELATMAELVRRVAAVSGRRPPRLVTPTWPLRAVAPLAARMGRNLGELVRASAGVTYWATDAKARHDLGYAPRDLEIGLREVFGR